MNLFEVPVNTPKGAAIRDARRAIRHRFADTGWSETDRPHGFRRDFATAVARGAQLGIAQPGIAQPGIAQLGTVMFGWPKSY